MHELREVKNGSYTDKGLLMDIEKSPLMQRPDYLVCTCMGVMHSDIVAAIEAGNKTYQDLQDTLMVGTGCSSCVEEVHEILKQELAAK